MIAGVPSVDPVSQITQQSATPAAERSERSMIAASLRTIMCRQSRGPPDFPDVVEVAAGDALRAFSRLSASAM